MSNSSLVTYTRLSPNRTSPRNHKIDTITIHCVVGQWTAKKIADYFYNTNRKASCNYGVGCDGSISLVVEEKDRSWCSSNSANDNRAITIEVASDTTNPYAVTNEALGSLVVLLADICKRNNIHKLVWSENKNDRVNHLNGCNMTVHRDFANKSCPGKYLYDRHKYIASAVNQILGVDEKEQFIEDIAKAVQKIAPEFGIKVCSPIIAQAILESAWGTSYKAQYHNYFGLKYRPNRCGSSSGTFIDKSKEQNKDGTYVDIKDQWFKFDNLELGVRGYFEFISIDRYNNLKGITDPRKYLELIKEDGYATSLNYVDNVYNIIVKNNLQKYDNVTDKNEEIITISKYKCPFTVKVDITDLNIRAGAGTGYKVNKVIPVGIYTITEVKQGKGSKLGWGKLKSGAGWISLDYCTYI